MSKQKKVIEEKAKQIMLKFHNEGLSIQEIADVMNTEESAVLDNIRTELSNYEYQKDLVRQRGFESYHEYQEDLARQKQRRPENQAPSNLIKRRLEELGKNQSWLARQLNVSSGTISKYTSGKRIPNKERLRDLFSVLDVPYQELEEIKEAKNGGKS